MGMWTSCVSYKQIDAISSLLKRLSSSRGSDRCVYNGFIYVKIIFEWKTLELACFRCELGTLLRRY